MKSEQNICVGTSHDSDSIKAGQLAACESMSLLERSELVGWALAFCGGRHNSEFFLEGLRSQLGEVEIVGGSTIGTISNSSISYTGYEGSVAIFPASIPKPIIIAVDELHAGETEAGLKLGSKLREIANDGDTVLLFYDSIRRSPPPELYTGSLLISGIYKGLAGKDLTLIGAGTVGDYQFAQSFVFDGSHSVKHTVVAVLLPSVLRSHNIIMHGCIPISSFLEVTRVEGPIIYELDGRPALEVISQMLQKEIDDLADTLSLTVTLGEKHGDLYAPYEESAYKNRLIINSNLKDGSVTLFEADFKVGTKIQIMSRNNQLMLDSVRKGTGELIKSIGQQKPIFALYTDCAGRASCSNGAEVEEASILQAELGKDIPLLGFYSGVEIAPVLGQSRPLDWTGVLTLFTLEG